MTYFTPRTNEVKTVLDLLESDQYETPEAMARAIVKAVALELSSKRDALGVALKLTKETSTILAVGPFYDKRDAEKYLEKAAENGLVGFTAPLTGTDALNFYEDTGAKRTCVSCGHAKEMHGVVKTKTCAVYKCECKELVTT